MIISAQKRRLKRLKGLLVMWKLCELHFHVGPLLGWMHYAFWLFYEFFSHSHHWWGFDRFMGFVLWRRERDACIVINKCGNVHFLSWSNWDCIQRKINSSNNNNHNLREDRIQFVTVQVAFFLAVMWFICMYAFVCACKARKTT